MKIFTLFIVSLISISGFANESGGTGLENDQEIILQDYSYDFEQGMKDQVSEMFEPEYITTESREIVLKDTPVPEDQKMLGESEGLTYGDKNNTLRQQYEEAKPVASDIGFCNSLHSTAKSSCSVQQNSMMASMLASLYGASKNGDAAKQCKSAAEMGKNVGLFLTAAAGTCKASISKCSSACEGDIAAASKNLTMASTAAKLGKPNPTSKTVAEWETDVQNYKKYENDCSKLEFNSQAFMLSSLQYLNAHQQAKGCEDALADNDDPFAKCNGEEKGNPEMCSDYWACNLSMFPENAEHPNCAGAVNQAITDPGQCASPTAAILEQCQMICSMPQYQAHPNCQQYLAGGPGSGLNPNGPGISEFNDGGFDTLGEDLDFIPDFDGYDGPVSQGGDLAGGRGSGGGGGGLGGGGSGGGAGAFPNGGPGGPGDSPYDTDIIGKASGGGSSGGGGIAGGYANPGSAWKRGGRAAGQDKTLSKFDLSKFLPKKDKAKGRKTASVSKSLSSMGITKANGLSNFQKVTRMLNKKRPELINKP